jgi:hypothetical protein
MSKARPQSFADSDDAGSAEWSSPLSNPRLGMAALSLAQGGGSQFLERMLALSTDHLGADGAALLAHGEGGCHILCSVGLPLSANIRMQPEQFEQLLRSDGALIEDARSHADTSGWDFIRNAPFWQSIRPARVHTNVHNTSVVAIFGSHNPVAPKTMRMDNPTFKQLMVVLRDLFALITEIADLSSRQVTFSPTLNVVKESDAGGPTYTPHEEAPGVVERFLMETLISQPRVLSRGNVSYHALKRWRKSVKNEQITALKSIKKVPNEAFENAIAEEMSSWCRRAFGATAFSNVVAVPCGHSGQDCLSMRMGRKIAQFLGLQFADAFEPLQVTGSSHPKTNVKRPKMKLKHVPVGPVLLIDDVATSGSHIEEAASALRDHEVAVIALAWIGAG